jgi:SAM-dependent methyltransferase
MDEALYDEMFRLESTHWWFVAKRRIILSLLKKYLPVWPSTPAPRVCDIGCGCGMILRELQDQGYQAVGVDASDTALSYCAARGVQAVKGMLPDRIGLPPGQADAVLLLDVLEHLDDDLSAALSAIDLLRPGGFLIATVPAYQWLWTARDEFHHHKRRYSLKRWRQMLRDATARCGSRTMTVSYFNTYLFPLALAGRLATKVLPQPDRPGDMSIPPLGINRMLAGIFASERWPLCAGIPLPFGLSLLAVMQKPSEPDNEGAKPPHDPSAGHE